MRKDGADSKTKGGQYQTESQNADKAFAHHFAGFGIIAGTDQLGHLNGES